MRKKRTNNPNAMIKITEYVDINDYMRQYNREYTRLQTRLRREANPKPILTPEEIQAKIDARKQKMREYYKKLRADTETRKELNRKQAECKKANPRYREKERVYKQARRYKQRTAVLSYYGVNGNPVCRHCGFNDMRALVIDHVNNDGAEHKKTINADIYRWLEKNNFPEGFQTLCHNCNYLKEYERKAAKTLATIEEELAEEEKRLVEAALPSPYPTHGDAYYSPTTKFTT